MEVEDHPSSLLSTPTGQRRRKGEEEGDVDENSKELNQVVMDWLRADGRSAANPIMKQLSSFLLDRYTEAEYTMTTLVVSLTRQVQELTVTVQKLARMVSDLKAEGAPTGTTTRQQLEPTTKSYAKAAAQGLQNATNATPAKGKKKVEVGPTPPKQQTTKIAKKTHEQQVISQPKGKNDSPKPKKVTKVAIRTLFATRITAKPLADPTREEARISLAVATVLTGCECKTSTNLQVFSNKTNGTITLTALTCTDSGQYAKYINKIAEALNGIIDPDEPKYLPFRRAPTDVDVIIYGVSLTAILNNNKDLEEEVKKTFRVTHKFEIAGAKFLKRKEEDRRDEKAISIIIRVPEPEVDNVTLSVLFMRKYKTSAVMWQASATTQSHKCWKFGHPVAGCKAPRKICPICSKVHTQREHKCHQTTCSGHRKIILGCCLMTPAKCSACGGPHSALENNCPEKLRVKEAAKKKYDLQMASLAGSSRTEQTPLD